MGLQSPPNEYRKNVGISLINPEKKGGMDDDEDPRVAAMRELREDTRVVSVEVVAEMLGRNLQCGGGKSGKGNPEMVESSVALMKSKPFIAELKFLLKFTGKDEEVNLLGDGTEKPELRDWVRMKPDDLIERDVNEYFWEE